MPFLVFTRGCKVLMMNWCEHKFYVMVYRCTNLCKKKYNIYRVACRFELPSSKSGSGDGANDLEVFVVPVVNFVDVVLSIAQDKIV